jgi:L-amino acid N-acyltransferase YncA
MIRAANISDAAAIARIYNYYVLNTVITFEQLVISDDEMAKRIQEIAEIPLPWLVAEKNGAVVGFAYASKWKTRYAYRYSAESTVYLDSAHTGNGLGSELYKELLLALRAYSVHSVMGGIAQPNPGSVALHEKHGFQKVAHLKEVGFKFDEWIDVAYWQVLL